jgi:hypothetical protein
VLKRIDELEGASAAEGRRAPRERRRA